VQFPLGKLSVTIQCVTDTLVDTYYAILIFIIAA
jgi:hypothetical protein